MNNKRLGSTGLAVGRKRSKSTPFGRHTTLPGGQSLLKNQLAILFGHRHHAIDSSPGSSFKGNPALQLMLQFPIVALLQQLLIKIQSDVVLHQNCFRWRTIHRVLRHLRELELHGGRLPFANRLAKGGMKGRRIELFHDVGP